MAMCVPKAIKSCAEMLRPGQDKVFTSQAKRPLFAHSGPLAESACPFRTNSGHYETIWLMVGGGIP